MEDRAQVFGGLLLPHTCMALTTRSQDSWPDPLSLAVTGAAASTDPSSFFLKHSLSRTRETGQEMRRALELHKPDPDSGCATSWQRGLKLKGEMFNFLPSKMGTLKPALRG